MTKKLILKTPIVSEAFLNKLDRFPEIQKEQLETVLLQEKDVAS